MVANRLVVCVFLYFSICSELAVTKAEETVSVAVYYESLCPGCRAFFLGELRPNFPLFATRIKLTLVPYGNAQTEEKSGKPYFICQHGPEECRGNMIQACVIQILNDTQASLDFVTCAFRQARQEESIQQCLQSTDVQNKVKQCANGPIGINLELQMSKLTNGLQPPHQFTPWITFNGEGGSKISEGAIGNFAKELCTYYKKDLPKQCQKTKISKGHNKQKAISWNNWYR